MAYYSQSIAVPGSLEDSLKLGAFAAPRMCSAGKMRAVKGKVRASQRFSGEEIGFDADRFRWRRAAKLANGVHMGSHRCQFAWTLALAGLLAGCSSNPDRYPSLAIRDAERFSGSFTPAPAEPADNGVPIADAATVAALVAKAKAAHNRFLQTLPATRQLVERATGLSPENNAWSAAQIALADLDAHRSAALTALGDIDLLAAQAATTFAPTDDIRAAQAEVREWVIEQNTSYESLLRRTDR